VQEKAMREYSASSVEMVFYSYSIGIVYMFTIAAATGSLVTPFYYCLEVLPLPDNTLYMSPEVLS
jgi:hypothetical protein